MAVNSGKRTRLTIDISPELRRRIKLAAAEQDLSLKDFLISVLERVVPPVEEHPRGRPVTEEIVELFKKIQSEQGPAFADDSTDL